MLWGFLWTATKLNKLLQSMTMTMMMMKYKNNNQGGNSLLRPFPLSIISYYSLIWIKKLMTLEDDQNSLMVLFPTDHHFCFLFEFWYFCYFELNKFSPNWLTMTIMKNERSWNEGNAQKYTWHLSIYLGFLLINQKTIRFI